MRNVPIDILRGASMLYIVGFWHLLDYCTGAEWHHNAATYRLTILVLAIFVMLSGYTIGNKRMDIKPDAIRNFYIDRFWRFYPPFVLASILFLILRISNWVLFAKGLTLTGMFFEPPPFTLWFVDMIVVFYLVTPFLIWLRPNTFLFTLFSVLILSLMLAYDGVAHYLDHRLFIYFPSFAAGIFLSKRSLPSSPIFCVALSALAAASLCPTLQHPMQELDQDFWSTPWALAGSLAVLVVFLNIGKQWPDYKFVFNLSTASYFMYLFHRPIYDVALKLFPSNDGLLQSIFLIAFCLPLTGLISWGCQRRYDKTLNKYGFVSRKPDARG